MAIDDRAFPPGQPVRDAAGKKIGTLVGAGGGTLTIETGRRFGRREVVVPAEAVTPRADGYVLEGDLASFERDPGLPLGGEAVTVPLHEETLVAEKHAVVRGHVRVSKRVVTEKRSLTVEVRREEVRIEHAPATASAAPATLEAHPVLGRPLEAHDGWMPLYEEEVEIVLRPRVREWIRVHKEVETNPKTFTSQVKREVAEVDADQAIADEVKH